MTQYSTSARPRRPAATLASVRRWGIFAVVDPRARTLFLLLVLAQALHSVEEYAFRLYDRFAPAHRISDALGVDRATGFLAANAAFVLVGLAWWSLAVRPQRRAGGGLAWFWAVLEALNGLVHILLALAAGGYFPGLLTAPLLLGLAAALIARLSRR